VAADHPPLVGRPGRVLVAVLEEHVTAGIDEEDDSDAGHEDTP
jgi:hypothetical protein